MEDALEAITRGNVAEVKIVLASVAAALAVYQVVLMAVGYGKLRLPFLAAAPASAAHRAAGDAIAVLTIVVATMCVTVFGFSEDNASAHVILACALLAVFAFKIVIVRWWRARPPSPGPGDLAARPVLGHVGDGRRGVRAGLMESPSHTRQMIGSLVAALVIVAIAIVAVTARLGPTSIAELDAREDRRDVAQERLEERQEARRAR